MFFVLLLLFNICIFSFLGKATNTTHDIPTLDSTNENKLAAMYASMDPSSNENGNSTADVDPSKCEIR